MRRYSGIAFGVLLVIVNLILTGCSTTEPGDQKIDAYFVRGGIAVSGPRLLSASVFSDKNPLAEWERGNGDEEINQKHTAFIAFDWRPGEKYLAEIITREGAHRVELHAPQKPSPMETATVKLENVVPFDSGMGSAPDTFLKFSPHGGHLAIGSFRGYLRIFDITENRVILDRKIAEGMVKQIGWGKVAERDVVFVGEQSPDSYIYCLDAGTGETIWKYRMADDVETSAPATADDRYSKYHYPGVFRIIVTPGNDVLAAGIHGWYRNGRYINRTVLYRFEGETGKLLWRWPEDRALPFGITWMDSDIDGNTITLATSSWHGPDRPDEKYRNDSVYTLDGSNGRVSWEYVIPPLEPYYDKAWTWHAISVSPDGKYSSVGLFDGRVMMFDNNAIESEGSRDEIPLGIPLWIKNVGTPVVIGDMPVAAQVSYSDMSREELFVLLPGTSIPPGSSGSRNRVPAPHPAANHIFSFDVITGELNWKFGSPGSTQGIYLSDDEHWLMALTSEEEGGAGTEYFGAMLFNLDTPGGGREKLVYSYPTEGPLFFMGDISSDGWYMALAEVPLRLQDQDRVLGTYQVHIIH